MANIYRTVTTHASERRFETRIRGHVVATDQPEDQGGHDLGPMPTELLLTSVGACVAHYAVEVLERHGVDLTGFEVVTTAQRAEDRPARFGQLQVDIRVPAGVPDDKKKRVLKAAQSCFVHHTLQHSPAMTFTLNGEATA